MGRADHEFNARVADRKPELDFALHGLCGDRADETSDRLIAAARTAPLTSRLLSCRCNAVRTQADTG